MASGVNRRVIRAYFDAVLAKYSFESITARCVPAAPAAAGAAFLRVWTTPDIRGESRSTVPAQKRQQLDPGWLVSTPAGALMHCASSR